MRLWSIHPSYLDTKGLVALWREGLLAQAVLLGKTKGYKNHPQLERFKRSKNPAHTIGFYLHCVCDEAERRFFHFDRKRITKTATGKLTVTSGQLKYEMDHLRKKLKARAPENLKSLSKVVRVKPHPLFYRRVGNIETWERPENAV